MQFSKSVRFSDKLGDAPGPGDYDPQDQRRASGVMSFGIQRFAIERETEIRPGPGHYCSTPNRSLAKRRRSSISLFSQTPKRPGLQKHSEDVINELTERLQESQNAFERESARASKAEENLKAAILSYNEEVSKRVALQDQLKALDQEQRAERDMCEQKLSESNETIKKFQERFVVLENEKQEAQQRVVELTSQISELEDAREVLAQGKANVCARLTSLEIALQESKQRETKLDAQVRQVQGVAEERVQEANARVHKAEAVIVQEQNKRTEEDLAHTADILELHTIIHNNQEAREVLLAKLGSSEVQAQDLMLRVRVLESDVENHVKLCEDYRNNLSAEVNRSERLVVELANREMVIEDTKSDLNSSEKLVCDLRERLLKEQHLSSEFEAKYNYEVSNVACELRASLSQQESVICAQKEQIEYLNTSLEKERANFLASEHEWTVKENSYKHRIFLQTNEVDLQNEKILNLQKELETSEYKISVSVLEKEEQQKVNEKHTRLLQELETEKQTQFADFIVQLEAKSRDMQVVKEKNSELASQNDTLTAEVSALRRERAVNESAVHAALANLELAQQDFHCAHLVVERQLAQLADQEKALLQAKEHACLCTQQLEKMTREKNEAVELYSAVSKTLGEITKACEEKELALASAEEKSKSLVQENAELTEDCDRLCKAIEANREMTTTYGALRQRVAELEASNRELSDSCAILDEEARESSSQTALLVGHNNQRQKIDILAKAVDENRKLKRENLRLSNSLLELKKASAQSLVLNSENIAPATPVRKNVMVLPASNTKRLAEGLEDTRKSGPLQESFQVWQQKKQRVVGTVERRTPLAPLGFSRQSLITPQKSIELH